MIYSLKAGSRFWRYTSRPQYLIAKRIIHNNHIHAKLPPEMWEMIFVEVFRWIRSTPAHAAYRNDGYYIKDRQWLNFHLVCKQWNQYAMQWRAAHPPPLPPPPPNHAYGLTGPCGPAFPMYTGYLGNRLINQMQFTYGEPFQTPEGPRVGLVKQLSYKKI